MFNRKLVDFTPRRVVESSTPPPLVSRKSPWWVVESLFKFFPNFKQLNQHFKRSICQKRSQACNVLSPLIYLNVWKKWIYSHSCRLPDSPSRGVVSRLRISPPIWSQNRNGSKCSVMDLCQTGLCKNPGKSASLPCPFQKRHTDVIRTVSCIQYINTTRNKNVYWLGGWLEHPVGGN
jgi:hypothetical protein